MARAALKFGRFGRISLQQEIIDSLAALPRMLREVFVRSHYQGQQLSEIAQELRIPRETAESLLQDANEIFYHRVHRFRI